MEYKTPKEVADFCKDEMKEFTQMVVNDCNDCPFNYNDGFMINCKFKPFNVESTKQETPVYKCRLENEIIIVIKKDGKG
jgi:hypothetical protein